MVGSGARTDGALTALAVGKVRDMVVVGLICEWRRQSVAGASTVEARWGAGDESAVAIRAWCANCGPPCVWDCASERVKGGCSEDAEGVLLSVDGYGRVVSHLIPKLLGSGSGVAAVMSSGAYSQSIASLSSNIYSSVSSVLRGTSLGLPLGGGDGLSGASGTSVFKCSLAGGRRKGAECGRGRMSSRE